MCCHSLRLDRLESWEEMNFVSYDKGKHRVLHLKKNYCIHHMLEADLLEKNYEKKALCVPVDDGFKTSQ